MRTSMLPSMLQVAATNWNRSVEKAGVFEIAYVYHPKTLPVCELPDEEQHLAAFYYDERELEPGGEYFRLKGAVEELFLHLGLCDVDFAALADCPWLHPGRSASILLGGNVIGTLGVIHPDAAGNFGASPRTVLLDLEIAPILATATEKRQHKPLPRYPAVMRDLAVLVDKDIPVARLNTAMGSAGGQYLEQIRLFDVYQGQQVPAGKKSVAFSLIFRSSERTLNDEDIHPVMQAILSALKQDFQAVLRE